MSDDLPMKTKTGNLDFHLAAAGCYVPVMMLNYLLPIVFLATEPREHHPVRFHAVQSLLVSSVWLVATFGLAILTFIVPFGLILIGSLLGMEDVLGGIGLLLQLLISLVLLVVSFGGMGGLVLLAVLTAMEKDPRVPMIAGFAERFVGESAA